MEESQSQIEDVDDFLDKCCTSKQNDEGNYITNNSIDIQYWLSRYSSSGNEFEGNENYNLLEDMKTLDPSVKFYIVTNLERLMRTCSKPGRSQALLQQITSMEFTNEIIGFSELIYEYINQILILSK